MLRPDGGRRRRQYRLSLLAQLQPHVRLSGGQDSHGAAETMRYSRRNRVVTRAIATLATAAFLAALAARSPAGAADDAAAILAKHRAFVGWTFGDPSAASWRITSEYSSTDDRGVEHTYTE